MKHAWIGLLALVLALTFLVEFRVVDRMAYQLESGRLRAQRELLADVDRIDDVPVARMIVETVMPSVVTIETENRVVVSKADDAPSNGELDWWAILDRLHAGTDEDRAKAGPLDDSGWLSVEHGIGSGFVVDAARGHVLTNAHVIDGVQDILVTAADGRSATAEVLGADRESDLALLHIDMPDLHEVRFGDSRAMQTGDEVYAFGNPLGLSGSVSRGIVSAVERDGVVLNEARYPGLLQTDAVISPGSSGGPLVNARGEVVGVNAAIATRTGQFDGVGFAIPVHKVEPLLSDLIDGGPSMLGVWISSARFGEARARARALGWEGDGGAIVMEVMEDLAAHRAGLKAGDIIVAVDGTSIVEGDELVRVVSSREPGTAVTVEVWRDGAILEFEVVLQRKYAPR